MNLGIEYLIRTGLIKDIFETPCSLMLVDCKSSKRMVITIEEKLTDYLVQHWDVESAQDFDPPKSIDFNISKEDTFTNDKVIVPGFVMITYRESYISTCGNTFRQPMPEFSYNSSYKNILCSQVNKWRREKWLWRCFLRKQDSRKISDIDFAMEQKSIKRHQPDYWDQWMHWKYKLLHNRVKVAAELVFHKEYENNTNRLFQDLMSSSFSFSFDS